MNACLMWELVEKPKWAFRLLLFAFLYTGMHFGTGMLYLYLIVLGIISLMGPAGDSFWILGLSKRDYNIQRRCEVAVSAAILVGITALTTDVHWVLIAGYLVIAAIVLGKNLPIPQRNGSRIQELVSGTSGRTEDGRFPPTIEGQLVIRPQVKGWGFIFCLNILAVLIYWGITAISGNTWLENFTVAPVIFSVFIFIIFEDTLTASLREYVRFGGTRESWARHTIIINAAVPALLIVIGAVVPGWSLVSALGALFLPLLIVIIALGLTSRPSWMWTVPVIIAGITLEVYVAFGIAIGAYVLPVLAVIAGYVVGGLLLPTIARKANLQSAGFSHWLGMASASR